MSYSLFILPAALKALERIPQPDRSRVGKGIDSLAHNPRPSGSVKLQNQIDLYRLRSGDYRIIYQIKDQELIVLVVRVGHRKEVYRKLKG